MSQGKKQRGTWHSEESVDASSLVRYRFELRKPYAKKEQEERLILMKEQNERELLMKMANAGAKRKAAVKHNPPQKKPKVMPMPESYNLTNPRSKMTVESIIIKHRDNTLRLLKMSAAQGQSAVPTHKMAETRHASICELKTLNATGNLAGQRKHLTDKDLTASISKAESEAVQVYLMELQKLAQARVQKAQVKKLAAMKATQPPVAQTSIPASSQEPSNSLSALQAVPTPAPAAHQQPNNGQS